LLIYGKPVCRNLPVQISIPNRCLFEPGAQSFHALMSDEMLYRFINEAAALARFRDAVDGLDGGFRQNDIDSFAHRIRN